MERYIYKKQGDGRDSWLDTTTGYMVYEFPDKPIPISNVDITTLTDEQLIVLKKMLDMVVVPTNKSMMVSTIEDVREEHKFVSKYSVIRWPWYKRLWKWFLNLFK